MRTTILLILAVLLCCSLASGAVLYKITFDNAAVGPAPATYTPGAGEVTLYPADVIAAFNNGGDGPEIVDAAAFLAQPFQGGKALRVQSGGKDEGYVVQMGGAGGPGPAVPPGDLTVEYIYMTTIADIGSANNSDLQYLGSTEWPGGQRFQWMLRIRGGSGPAGTDCIYFWTDKGDLIPPADCWVGSLSSVQPNRWYHVAAVLDYNTGTPASSTIYFYVDGVLQGSDSYDATDNSFSLGNSGSQGHIWTIGYNSNVYAGMTDHRGLDGAIDAVAISDQALAPGSFVLPTQYVEATPTPLSGVTTDWTIYQ